MPENGDARASGLAAAAYRLLSDERLARLAAAGDRVAFAVIFDRYQQSLYAYCASLLRDRDDAADALQSTMLHALRALDGEDREIAIRPWLYRIAHNEAMNLLRRPRTEPAEQDQPSVIADVEASADVRAQLRTVLDDIRELPERQRGALVMRELAGLGYDEIAAALKTSAGGAKQAVYDARRALFELARGRDTDCETIQRQISDGDRRTIRARPVRAHLSGCMSCRAFHLQMASRQSSLASFTPALPAAVAGQAIHGALAGTTAGTGMTTAGGQAMAVAAVAAALGAGAVGVHELNDGPDKRTERAAPSITGDSPTSRSASARPVARALGKGLRARGAGAPRTAGGKAAARAKGGGAGGAAGKGGGTSAEGPGRARSTGVQVTPTQAVPAPESSERRGALGRLVRPNRPRRPQNGGPVGSIVAETRGPVNEAIDQTQQSLPVRTPEVPSVPGIRPPKTPKKPL